MRSSVEALKCDYKEFKCRCDSTNINDIDVPSRQKNSTSSPSLSIFYPTHRPAVLLVGCCSRKSNIRRNSSSGSSNSVIISRRNSSRSGRASVVAAAASTSSSSSEEQDESRFAHDYDALTDAIRVTAEKLKDKLSGTPIYLVGMMGR